MSHFDSFTKYPNYEWAYPTLSRFLNFHKSLVINGFILAQELQLNRKLTLNQRKNTMKINDKYEISPFGNAFDSLFSLLTRNDQSPISNYPSSISEYGNVRIKNEEKQVRIEFLVPGWKKNDLSLSIEDQKLRLSSKPSNEKELDGLFQSKELDVQVLLGEKLDTDKTNAKLEQGVLTVTIPVTSKVTGKSIKIS